jgi:probable HAF family extracellular repeat protein
MIDFRKILRRTLIEVIRTLANPHSPGGDMTKKLLLILMVLCGTMELAIGDLYGQAGPQERSGHSPRYDLLDIGTFGGRASYVNPQYELGGPNQMNRRGMTVGAAATSIPSTQPCPFCDGLDGQVKNVIHAFRWTQGETKDLGSLRGRQNSSVAISINAEGAVVGHSENGIIDPKTGFSELRAVLWTRGEIVNLGTFGGNDSLAAMINNREQVIGSALNAIPDPFSILGLFLGSTGPTQTRAFLWEDGHKRDLGTLGGPDAFAGRINNLGEIIGTSYINSVPNQSTGVPTTHPFLWREGKMVDLGDLGGTASSAGGINDHTQIIGNSNLAGDQVSDPFLWEEGRLMDLNTNTLGGNPITANAINNAGEIVGGASFPGHPFSAYVRKYGVALNLGVLGDDCFSEALLTNSQGQVTGQSFSCDLSSARTFLWQNGQMFELNQLIRSPHSISFTQAFVINDEGEIGGIGTPPNCTFDEDCGHALFLMPSYQGSERHDESAIPSTQEATKLDDHTVQAASAVGTSAESRQIAARIQAKFGRSRGSVSARGTFSIF